MAKSLPFNAEAEMSVLGVAFISKDQVDKICESVNEDMFFDEKNKYLYEPNNLNFVISKERLLKVKDKE